MRKHGLLENRTLTGLCSGCQNEAVCTYPKAPDRPVLNCLEFEELSGIWHNGSAGRAKPLKARLGVTVRAAPPLEPGLCATCDLRPTCQYPKHAGGVWFCEEYC